MRPTPLSALAKFLGIKHPSHILIPRVSIDSRLVREDDLFFALPGARVDGHDFLEEVARKGATAAIVHSSYAGESYGLELLYVPDVLGALQELARKVLQTCPSKVVAIAGSLGKTTTKVFAHALLKGTCRVYASPRSYNSQATLPLSILQARGDEDILLLEMGMSEPGNIANLVSIAPPDVAVITTVAVQHANLFSDGLEGITREKSHVLEHPKTQLGLINRGLLEKLADCGSCRKKTFSIEKADADYVLDETGYLVAEGKRVPLELNLPMRAHAQNVVAAIAIARFFDVSWEGIQEIVPKLQLPPMRFEKIERDGVTFINDAYNANPDAMVAALQSLPLPHKGGRRIAVLTAMGELGQYTAQGHIDVATHALDAVDLLLCLGKGCDAMRQIWEAKKRPVLHFETHESLLEHLKADLNVGDVVLLKGARSAALETLLEGLK